MTNFDGVWIMDQWQDISGTGFTSGHVASVMGLNKRTITRFISGQKKTHDRTDFQVADSMHGLAADLVAKACSIEEASPNKAAENYLMSEHDLRP